MGTVVGHDEQECSDLCLNNEADTSFSKSGSFFYYYYFSARKDTNKTEDSPSPISEQNQRIRKCIVNCQFAKSRNNMEFFLNIDIVTGMMCVKELGKEGKWRGHVTVKGPSGFLRYSVIVCFDFQIHSSEAFKITSSCL